ncbi:MAG: thiamine-phosphate kinase [Candidatus Methylomirabilis sp.]|nr:thiamine-phosphate kinase [Deltaproteobacteria bacterium]
MRLKDIGEDALIGAIAKRFAARHPRLTKGIGDDACVIRELGGRVLLATTDVLIEDTHFKRSYTPPRLLGRKALSISLSDIAAMGGEPLFFLVSIALPPDTDKGFVDGLYDGLGDAGGKSKCLLIGGNTAKSRHGITVSTTVFGEAPANEVAYRKGARAGDLVFVTGELGSSALGLWALGARGKAAAKGPYRGSVAKHLDPEPRLTAGKALAASGLASSMMDLSDGLALDLKRLCIESGRAAVVNISSLPASKELQKFGRQAGRRRMFEFALTGGEDYELLFTSPESNLKSLSRLSRRLSLPFTPIGRIVPAKSAVRAVTVLDEDGSPVALGREGFEHF